MFFKNSNFQFIVFLFHTINCSLLVSTCLLLFVTAQLGGGGNTFRCCTEWPTSINMDFSSYMRRQAVGAIIHINFQLLLFVGQSSLRSDSRSTAKSITTSALRNVCIKCILPCDKGQVHRCSCYGSNGFVTIE